MDADGHYIESAPVFKHFLRDYVSDIAGGDLAKRFEQAGGMDYDEMVLRPWGALSWEERRAAWHPRPRISKPTAFRVFFLSRQAIERTIGASPDGRPGNSGPSCPIDTPNPGPVQCGLSKFLCGPGLALPAA